MRAAILAALVLLQASLVACQFGQTFSGDGTYYGNRPDAKGHCSFQDEFAGASRLPWIPSNGKFVAINHGQYAGSATCGMCVKFRGTGAGLGGNPISTSWQYGIITDECPECKQGDLDLAVNGDGRWKIEWQPVQCDTKGTKFYYSTQGSHNYYTKLSITNTRVPPRSVDIMLNGQWTPMKRWIDNYWVMDGGNYNPLPLKIRVTSIFGETVTDTVDLGSWSDKKFGNAQFSVNGNYEVIGGGGGNDNGSGGALPPRQQNAGGKRPGMRSPPKPSPKKSPPKYPVKKSPPKKSPAKKSPPKKSPVKKSPPRKSPTKAFGR